MATFGQARALMREIQALTLWRDKTRYTGVSRFQADQLNIRVFATGYSDDQWCPFYPDVVRLLNLSRGAL